MDLGLKGKFVLITGGSKGIGLAIKNKLMEEGAYCIDISRYSGFDLLKDENVFKVTEMLDDVDILINNYGGGGTWKSGDLYDVMAKNLGVTAILTNAFLKRKKKWGRIITIGSIYGKEKGPNVGFATAKVAQIAFMKGLAGSYPGTTFNTVCPGCINTKKEIRKYAKKNKMTLGEPEDVANIVTFLCSDNAKHINGACITVDGGDSHSF